MSKIIEELKSKIKGKNIKIVFPESEDPRIVEGAIQLKEEGILEPIFIGNEEKLTKDLKGIKVINPLTYPRYSEFVEAFVERREGKVSYEQAKELLKKPNYFGTMLVYMNEADGLVSGAAHSTADTVRPALQIIKTKEGVSRTFGYFLMLKGEEKYIMGDCAINPNPDSAALAEFAIESAKAAEMFGIDPKVALLSFSTNGSADTDETQKIKKALEIAQSKNSGYLIDGEMQFDAAFVESVGKSKYKGSLVAGQANTFIFPDLNSGNIGYKIAQRMGGYEAVGPILAGLNKPVNDLSRGCSVLDVYNTAIITASQSL
ncbi:MAG: phosphate acetyltransferase [Candidatus Izemoplasmataceae bacterium]